MTRVAAGTGAVGAIATLVLLLAILPATPLDYDEADYAWAAARGVAANAFDTGALPITEVARLGWRAVAGSGGAGAGRARLSERIRGSDDVAFYRHFHGPLFFYGLAAAEHGDGVDERALRTVAAVSVALAVGLAGFFAVALATALGTGAGAVAGLVGVLFAASAPILVETGTTAKPHALFAATAVATVGAAAMFVATGRRGWWRAAAVALGLAGATLEYAPLLVLALGLALVVAPAARTTGRGRLAGEAAAVAAATLLVVWPGALLRLSLVKSYAFFAYYATLRAADYGDVSPLRMWAARVADSPALGLAAAAALAVVARAVGRGPRAALAPVIGYVVALVVVNGRNHSSYAPYAASVIAPLALVLGVVAAAAAARGGARGRAAVAVVALAMPVATWRLAWPGLAGRLAAGSELAPVVAAARDGRLAPPDGSCVAVPFALVPRIHLYAPAVPVRAYYPEEPERFGPCPRSIDHVDDGGTARWVVVSR